MPNNNQDKVLNAPPLRFPEFSGEWKEHPLTDYLEFKNGMNPNAKRFGRGTKFISVMDILNNRYICYDNIRASVETDEKEMENYSVNNGDILFQRSSETLEDVGQANVYLDNKPAVFGGFVIRGKKIGDYNPLFFRYLLSSPYARKRIIVKGAGAQHFNIGQDGLSKVSLYFPSNEEQRKIANLLNLIDERIATQIGLIEDLKKLKSAIIHLYFDESNAPIVELSNYLRQVSQRNKASKNYPVLSVSNKSGFVSQSEQFEDRVIASDDTSNYKVVGKDMFAYNPVRINVGSIARYSSDNCGIVSPMYVCFRTSEALLPQYFEYYFQTTAFKHEMYKRLEGSVRLCLTYESLTNIKIALPPIEEQKKIAERLSSIEKKIAVETEIKECYVRQRQFLLSQMFV